MKHRRKLALALVSATLTAGLLIPSTVVSASTTPSTVTAVRTADSGARVVHEIRLDERTIDLVIDSPALRGTASVRLLLPASYAGDPNRRYPQLWLLHGCCADNDDPPSEDYVAWTLHTDVKEFTADKGVMVIMPGGGHAGFYTKWQAGTPDWETFHTQDVRQIIERNYRVNENRAVAGLSIGGYGAMAYAFKHQGMFKAAASYSGLPNTLMPSAAQWISMLLMRQGFGPWDLWGPEWWTPWVWRANNPFDNVEKLRGTALYVSAGNGRQGPLDPPTQGDAIEATVAASSRTFTDLLRQRGIPVTTNYYGDGTHAWPYWERELHTSWPFLAKAIGM